jgi:hypothetical protein
MRLIFAALAVLLTTPAFAFVWWDADGMLRLETVDGGLSIYAEDMAEPMLCRVREWPVKGPISHYDCEDGYKIELEVINLETVLMNGEPMTTRKPF